MSFVSGRLFSGQNTGVTTSAARLHASQSCRQVLVQNDPGNSVNLLIGDVDGQYIIVKPSQSISINIISVSEIYVKSASGTITVNWLASE